jgi:glycosyltransferase involved in cell wall biosynthesis
MKVSVIIPVYNGEKYIRQTLESALAQTYERMEFIIVNDGSTEQGTRESRRPRVIWWRFLIRMTYGTDIRWRRR